MCPGSGGSSWGSEHYIHNNPTMLLFESQNEHNGSWKFLFFSGEPPGTRTLGPRLKSTDTGEENQHDDSSQPSDE